MPVRNADSPVSSDDGKLLFVKPLEEEQEFAEFLSYVISQELDGSNPGEVRYAQSRKLCHCSSQNLEN